MSDAEHLGLGEIVAWTAKALRVRLDEIGEERWIPKSVFHDDSEVFSENSHREGEVVVKSWWAEQNGLV